MAAGIARDPSLVLAFHSTWDVVGAALIRDGKPIASLQLEGGRAAILLLEALAQLTRDSGRELAEVSRLAVSVGPGSFTGIKVGLATAWGLSRTLGIGIVGIDSLEVLAAQADPSAPIAALLPAGRGDVYLASYGTASPDGARPVLHGPALATPSEAAKLLSGATGIHLGCGHLLAGLSLRGCLEGDAAKLAPDLGRLASTRQPLAAGRLPDPLYLRRTWAEEVRQKRLAESS